MDTMAWIVCANAIVWGAIGAYLIFMAIKQKSLTERLERLEHLND